MNDIVFLKNEEAMTDSLMVAEMFEKRHDRILRAIENIIGGLPKIEDTKQLFVKSWYIEEQNGQRYPKYLMNRDGFSLLVMGFTGKKALEWKLKYISAFNKMEKIVRERQTQDWISTRKQGKLTRQAETAVIKKLVEYAKEQGSEHADKLYITYSKLANKMANIQNRDTATTQQLMDLSLMENIILHQIDLGILSDKHYREIYKSCKDRLILAKQIAYIG